MISPPLPLCTNLDDSKAPSSSVRVGAAGGAFSTSVAPTLALSRAVGVGLTELLGVLLNEEETTEYRAKFPTEVGLYRHS